MTPGTPSIEVFADIVCPFAYVGIRRLIDARQAAGVDTAVRVRAWPLEWINGAPLAAAHVEHEIDALVCEAATDLFAGFDPLRFPRTSIPAFGLCAVAYERDDRSGEAASLAVREAVFERGLDIADDEVLDAIADDFGLVRPTRGAAAAAARSDWERGRTRGVNGSPHFFVGTRGWFCPTLRIARDGDHFDVHASERTMREFHSAALG